MKAHVCPNYAEAYSNLGASYYLQGRLTEAIEVLVHAIQLDPSLADAYFNLVAVYVARRERSAALDQYSKLRTLDPELARNLFKGIYNGKVVDVADRASFRKK